MEKTVFIHIGQHKTGTTALQLFCVQNEELLLQEGLLYPKTGRVDLEGNPATRHFLLSLRPLEDPELIPELVYEIEESPATKVLISGEGFCRASARPALQQGVQRLATALSGHQLKVIVYLRPQEELIQSLYNWRVKEGVEHRTFETFLAEHFDDNTEYFEYDKMLAPFVQFFGQENVIVRIYESSLVQDGKLFKDFFQAMGHPWNSDYVLSESLAHKGVSPPCLEVMRLLRTRSQDVLPKASLLAEFIENTLSAGGNCFAVQHRMLSKADKGQIRARFEESNKKVAQELLGKPDGGLFPDIRNTPHKPSQESMSIDGDDLLDIVISLWKSNLHCVKQLQAEKMQKDESLQQCRELRIRNDALEKDMLRLLRQVKKTFPGE